MAKAIRIREEVLVSWSSELNAMIEDAGVARVRGMHPKYVVTWEGEKANRTAETRLEFEA